MSELIRLSDAIRELNTIIQYVPTSIEINDEDDLADIDAVNENLEKIRDLLQSIKRYLSSLESKVDQLRR